MDTVLAGVIQSVSLSSIKILQRDMLFSDDANIVAATKRPTHLQDNDFDSQRERLWSAQTRRVFEKYGALHRQSTGLGMMVLQYICTFSERGVTIVFSPFQRIFCNLAKIQCVSPCDP